MVSQESSPNPASSILHQFIISDTFTGQNQFENHHFDAYGSDLRSSSTFSPSLGSGSGSGGCLFPSIQSLGERMSRSIHLVPGVPGVGQESDQISHTRHLMDLLGAANDSNHHQAHRLSLSLGSHVLVPPVHSRQRPLSSEFMTSSNYLFSGEEAREACNPGVERMCDDYSYPSSSPFATILSSTPLNRSCSTSYGPDCFVSAVANSRYLRPAQSLLEEVVNMGMGGKSNEKYIGRWSQGGRRGALGGYASELRAELCGNGSLPAEKKDVQMEIAKLIGLLEEVESRYEEYYHQMEEVVSSFEVIAGVGAAKSYTSLALQAMFRHFCSLRDAIVSQLNAARRKVCPELPRISTGFSQLSLFEQEISGRNSRSTSMSALQQLGVFQSHRQVWRPIRGLPETSVAILRSWLFEHFLHPYPNDSEKLMLASQTGLTKNQVSNWFINARVRLWKPMIEEMYKEEFAESSSVESDSLLASTSSREGGACHY